VYAVTTGAAVSQNVELMPNNDSPLRQGGRQTHYLASLLRELAQILTGTSRLLVLGGISLYLEL